MSKIYAMDELKKLSNSSLRKVTNVRIHLDVRVFDEIENTWSKMAFIHRAELTPRLFAETFWDELREHVKNMYINCDRLYGFSNYVHNHEFRYQLEYS